MDSPPVTSADLIAAAMERRLSEITDRPPDHAASSSAELADDVLIVSLGQDEVEARPPLAPALSPNQEHGRAIAVFRELARSKDPLVRTAALVRLGRNLRKSGRHQEAREFLRR